MNGLEKLVKFASLYLEAAKHPRADYMREYMKNRYHSKRDAIIKELAGEPPKCAICKSESGPWHLDHKNKNKKTFRAADIHSTSDKKVQKEKKNLQVLCHSCHIKKTKDAWDYATPKPKHGTYWNYRKHGCRCKKCVEAFRAKTKEWRERNASSDMNVIRNRDGVIDAMRVVGGDTKKRMPTNFIKQIDEALENIKHLNHKLENIDKLDKYEVEDLESALEKNFRVTGPEGMFRYFINTDGDVSFSASHCSDQKFCDLAESQGFKMIGTTGGSGSSGAKPNAKSYG